MRCKISLAREHCRYLHHSSTQFICVVHPPFCFLHERMELKTILGFAGTNDVARSPRAETVKNSLIRNNLSPRTCFAHWHRSHRRSKRWRRTPHGIIEITRFAFGDIGNQRLSHSTTSKRSFHRNFSSSHPSSGLALLRPRAIASNVAEQQTPTILRFY